MLQRERKRRVEAAEAFRAGGREEQAEDEEYELEVLEEFMPEPMSEEEIEEIIDDVISEVGATNIRDMGRVMAGVMHPGLRPCRRLDGLAARQGEAGLTWLTLPSVEAYLEGKSPDGIVRFRRFEEMVHRVRPFRARAAKLDRLLEAEPGVRRCLRR